VFDGERLDLLVEDPHPLEATELADPVVEVNDVVARLELREALERDGATEAAAAADPAGAAEDLVVGQDAERRLCALEDEAAGERAERECAPGRELAAFAEQLLESLELPRVVTEE